MTKQSDILNDPNAIPVLDHGFVRLVATMGSDADIVSAARVSYGDGTKSVNEDRGLIRYLISHRHTSPIEMAEVKLHVKCPLFIARQWIRHRTASINEYSGRYSIMSDEFYRPTGDVLQPQSKTNKQGRDGEFTDQERAGVEWMMNAAFESSYEVYKALVTPGSELTEDERKASAWDCYDEDMFDEDFPGLSRELARTVLPLSNYTEFYWKQNLHNLLHLIKLRRDSHAQKEIRDYAEAVFQLIRPLFPLTVEAWEDYVWDGRHLSRMEAELIQELLNEPAPTLWQQFVGRQLPLDRMIKTAGGEKEFAKLRGFSLRELRAFRKTWKV